MFQSGDLMNANCFVQPCDERWCGARSRIRVFETIISLRTRLLWRAASFAAGTILVLSRQLTDVG